MAAPIPPEYLDDIEAAHFATGVPSSWIAAVCDRTGWNPYYELINIPDQGCDRRVGIAGIWCSVPELPYGKNCGLGPSAAGWFICAFYGCRCEYGGFGENNPPRDVRGNMMMAANILKNCESVTLAVCGKLTGVLFLRWMWGCNWYPIDPISGDPVCDSYPPGIPNTWVREIDDIIAAQKVYADQFGEPYFGAPPLTISISASQLTIGVGQAASFIANAQGGKPPYTYQWNFGDMTPVVETTNTSVSHTYADIGVYPVSCRVIDSLGDYADSSPLPITVQEEPVAQPSNVWLWALLAAGAAAALALAAGKKDKRQQAQQLRQKAQALRAEASRLRGQGRNDEATRLEQEAGRLEDQATRLEQEAAREDVERAQQQQRR